jgi:hypothetical protein
MIEKHDFGFTITGEKDIRSYRLVVMKSGLELECMGLNPARQSIAQQIRKEFHITARKKIDVYKQFCKMHGFTPKSDDQLQKRF